MAVFGVTAVTTGDPGVSAMYSYAAPVLAVGLILFDVTVTLTLPSAYGGEKREEVKIHWVQSP